MAADEAEADLTELIAILGLQGPSSRLEDPVRLLPALEEQAAQLTRALGGRVGPHPTRY